MIKITKTILYLLVGVVVVAGIWYIVGEGPGNSELTSSVSGFEEEPIKIGIIASLTGKGAARGESSQQGLELALRKIYDSGILKGKQIKLLYQDAPLVGGGKNAVTAFHFLTEIEKVVAVIGPMGSNTALAVTPLVDGVGIPTIIHTASTKGITENNEYVFRLWPTAKSYANAIISQIQKQGYKRIAALSAINDNTIDLLDFLKEDFKAMGEEISFIIDERATTEVNDFRAQLTKIKEADVDVLFLNLFEGQIGAAAKQAQELGLEIPLFSNGVMSSTELKIAKDSLEGIWYPRFSGYTDTVKQEFIEMYEREPINPEGAAAAHDALIALIQAIDEVGISSEKIKDYLYAHTFNGSIGEFKFERNGDATVPLKIKVVRNGQIVDF